MNQELVSHLAPAATSDTAAPAWLQAVGAIAAGSVLVAICAHLSLPLWFTPAPLTLQSFAVLLAGLLLSLAVGCGRLRRRTP